MTSEQKKWIDNATYFELLRRWRFAPVGDSMFQGDTGDYYSKVMATEKEIIGHDEAVRVSKKLS